MTTPSPLPQTQQPAGQVRYLKLIAIFKFLQGVLVLSIGISLIFLNSRTSWLNGIGDWAGEELALAHSRPATYLLNQLQTVVAGGQLRATGLVALFYAAVLFVEGVGVYLQKRWAEWFMVCATGALIPLELRHFWRHPSAVSAFVLAANCFIVWFLYRVLRRDKHEPPPVVKPAVAEVR